MDIFNFLLILDVQLLAVARVVKNQFQSNGFKTNLSDGVVLTIPQNYVG